MTKYLYFMGGMLAGVALIFYEVDMPTEQRCATYTVRTKAVTAYVLKPPYVAPEIIHEKCPVQKLTEPVQSIEEPVAEEKPRRHRRRHRRYWR